MSPKRQPAVLLTASGVSPGLAIDASARDKQDADYRVLRLNLDLSLAGVPELEATESLGECDPVAWPLGLGGEPDPELSGLVRAQVLTAVEPWLAHFSALGMIRADDIYEALNGDPAEGANPIYCLIYPASENDEQYATMLDVGPIELSIGALPGAVLNLSTDLWTMSATVLHRTLCTRPPQLGWWGGAPTDGLLPNVGEDRETWLSRVAVPAAKQNRAMARWKRSGGDLTLYGLCGSASERAAGDHPIEWIIPGLVPRGYVTLLVGTKMAGKSTLLGEMAAAFDSQSVETRSILGIAIPERGVACIVSGEDGDNFVNSRGAYYTERHGDPLGFVIDTSIYPWPEALEKLWSMPCLDLLCVDPLRAMLIGDEDASSVISPFFDDLNELARRKNCGVVLVHHISKNVPRSLSAMLKVVRGSSVATDRPRVVIGMLDRGAGVTEVGIIKHNMPPSEAMWDGVNVGRLFRRDAATLTLAPIQGAVGAAQSEATDADLLDIVHRAIADQNELRATVHRTGDHELHRQNLPELLGLSRRAIRDAVTTLLASGRLTGGNNGIRAVLGDE